MGRRVAVEARHGTGEELGPDIRGMPRGLQELLRLGVAGEAAHVRVGATDLQRLRVVAGQVVHHVANAVSLGRDGPEHPVVGVARVAVVLPDVAVLEVDRRERLAVGVLQVLDVWGHDVAAATRGDGLHSRDPLRVAEEDHDERKDGEPEKEGAFHAIGGAGPSDAPPGDEQNQEIQQRERDPQPLRPLIRRADPARGPGDGVLGDRDRRRRHDPQNTREERRLHGNVALTSALCLPGNSSAFPCRRSWRCAPACPSG